MAITGFPNLRISPAQSGERVGVAAGQRDLAVARRESLGVPVGGWQHLTIQHLNGGKILGEIVKISFCASAGESRKSVIDREQKLALVEVCEQGGKVVAAALDFEVRQVTSSLRKKSG
jgi:hypothetical protein